MTKAKDTNGAAADTKAANDTNQGSSSRTAATEQTSAQQGAKTDIAGTAERKPGTDDAGNVTTESGRNVGTWPDNGQPQKAGEPGEKSPETESAPPEAEDDDSKDETPINPQKAGEPGDKTPESASTVEDVEATGGRPGDASSGLTTKQRKLARILAQIGQLSKLRDQVQAEVDEEAEANAGKQSKTALEAYRETVRVQRENRQEARERFSAARQAAGGVTMHTDKAPVDDRRRAGQG